MANVDRPYGLKPIYHKYNDSVGAPMKRAAGGSVKQGDPVKKNASAKYVKATPGDRIDGVAANAAATNGDLWVYIDPHIVYEIQQDASRSLAEADYGLFADIATEHAGNATLGISGVELDATTATTALAQLRIESRDNSILSKEDASVALGSHADILVSIFEHGENVVQAADATPGI